MIPVLWKNVNQFPLLRTDSVNANTAFKLKYIYLYMISLEKFSVWPHLGQAFMFILK